MSYLSRSFNRRKIAALWAAGIALLLLLPGSMFESAWLEPWWRHFVDSIAHGVLFFVLAILVWRSLAGRRSVEWALTIGFCLSYAVLLELLQIPIPGRSFERIDIVAAFLGILAALVLTELLRRAPRDLGTGILRK